MNSDSHGGSLREELLSVTNNILTAVFMNPYAGRIVGKELFYYHLALHSKEWEPVIILTDTPLYTIHSPSFRYRLVITEKKIWNAGTSI